MFERDPERVYDLRTLQRNLERGVITREQYQQHLDALEDKEENVAPVESSFVEGILSDDDKTHD